ncbi:hypothetical protein MMC28_003214 [Mycoblastus sanguinarius]|nr:hypothetical protein [Mycoblastus sanguinarius]
MLDSHASGNKAHLCTKLYDLDTDFDLDARSRYAHRITKAYEKIADLRHGVSGARLDLHKGRKVLYTQHSTIRDLEAQFWKELHRREGSLAAINDDPITNLSQELQQALDKLGLEEEDYGEKEIDLLVLERELSLKEEQFYHEFSDPQFVYLANPDFTTPTPNCLSPRSSGTETEGPDPTNPYRGGFGVADVLRERIDDLVAERDHYLSIQQDREVLGVPLYQPNVDFLRNFENVYAGLKKELEEVDKQSVTDLYAGSHVKNDVIKQRKLEEENGQPRCSQAAKAGTLNDRLSVRSMPVHPGSKLRESIGRPKQFRFDMCKSDGDLVDTIRDCPNSLERINQWILNSMSVSAVERSRHWSMLNAPLLEQRDWWSQVLKFWHQDRAGEGMLSRERGPVEQNCASKDDSESPPTVIPISDSATEQVTFCDVHVRSAPDFIDLPDLSPASSQGLPETVEQVAPQVPFTASEILHVYTPPPTPDPPFSSHHLQTDEASHDREHWQPLRKDGKPPTPPLMYSSPKQITSWIPFSQAEVERPPSPPSRCLSPLEPESIPAGGLASLDSPALPRVRLRPPPPSSHPSRLVPKVRLPSAKPLRSLSKPPPSSGPRPLPPQSQSIPDITF